MKIILLVFVLTLFLFITGYDLSGSFCYRGKSLAYHQPGYIFGSTPLALERSSPLILAMASTSKSTSKPASKSTSKSKDASSSNKITLPAPCYRGSMSVEEAIKRRRTKRSFLPTSLSRQQLSQILWAALGITEEGGNKRSVPSAGALNPLDIFVVSGKDGISQMEEGVYHYQPTEHQLIMVTSGDLRNQIADAALGQTWLSQAPMVIVITAEYARTTRKYGDRGIRYAHMEVGHVAQNIFLQAGALELGAGIVGAFDDDSLKAILKLPDDYDPLLLMPVGKGK